MKSPPAICVCVEVSRAARALAARYDAALAPHGLTSGQFSVLMALHQMGQGAMGPLARVLGLDRTTLTRNLTPLRAAGLIEPAVTLDARQRAWQATAAGQSRFAAAYPAWEVAHHESLRRLGQANWPVLAGLARELAE